MLEASGDHFETKQPCKNSSPSSKQEKNPFVGKQFQVRPELHRNLTTGY